LIFVVGSRPKLVDGNFKLGIHILLFFLNLEELILKISSILLAFLLLILEDLKLSLCISESHNSLFIVSQLLLKRISLSNGVGEWDF